jgi:dinuclear metal center YbgI/SA1388 family protein
MAKQPVLRDDLVAYLDRYLRVAEIPDASPNGLQVQGADRVRRVAYAVDASVETIDAASRARAGVLVVHHGLWWGRHEPIVGNMHRRVSALIQGNVSLYAAHLPLDCHAQVGNNVELARLLRLRVSSTFAAYQGVDVGVIATAPRAVRRDAFAAAIERTLGATASLLPFGPATIRRVAVVTGGGARFAEAAARAGCDVLVTGESAHAAVHPAKEAGINLIFAGHYATETVGLKALDRHVQRRFGLPGVFIPAPTGY